MKTKIIKIIVFESEDSEAVTIQSEQGKTQYCVLHREGVFKIFSRENWQSIEALIKSDAKYITQKKTILEAINFIIELMWQQTEYQDLYLVTKQ